MRNPHKAPEPPTYYSFPTYLPTASKQATVERSLRNLVNIIPRLRLPHHLRLLHQFLPQPTTDIPIVVFRILIVALVVIAVEMHGIGLAAALRLMVLVMLVGGEVCG